MAERTAERAGLLNALHRVSHIGESPPHLQEVHHLSRTAAAPHASLLLPGVAIGAVIVGIFLGTGILQPPIGWWLDRGRASGSAADAYPTAVALPAGAAVAGGAASFLVRESAKLH